GAQAEADARVGLAGELRHVDDDRLPGRVRAIVARDRLPVDAIERDLDVAEVEARFGVTDLIETDLTTGVVTEVDRGRRQAEIAVVLIVSARAVRPRVRRTRRGLRRDRPWLLGSPPGIA